MHILLFILYWWEFFLSFLNIHISMQYFTFCDISAMKYNHKNIWNPYNCLICFFKPRVDQYMGALRCSHDYNVILTWHGAQGLYPNLFLKWFALVVLHIKFDQNWMENVGRLVNLSWYPFGNHSLIILNWQFFDYTDPELGIHTWTGHSRNSNLASLKGPLHYTQRCSLQNVSLRRGQTSNRCSWPP